MAILASAVTPLLIVLAGIFGAGVGLFFIETVRRETPAARKQRELAIARDTARKTIDATVKRLFGDEPVEP